MAGECGFGVEKKAGDYMNWIVHHWLLVVCLSALVAGVVTVFMAGACKNNKIYDEAFRKQFGAKGGQHD